MVSIGAIYCSIIAIFCQSQKIIAKSFSKYEYCYTLSVTISSCGKVLECVDAKIHIFAPLVQAYRDESSFYIAVKKCDNPKTDYDLVSKHCKGRFPRLEEFSGALASVPPNVRTVESDFSVIDGEKNE